MPDLSFLKDIIAGMSSTMKVVLVTVVLAFGVLYVYLEQIKPSEKSTPSIVQGGNQTSGASSSNIQSNNISI